VISMTTRSSTSVKPTNRSGGAEWGSHPMFRRAFSALELVIGRLAALRRGLRVVALQVPSAALAPGALDLVRGASQRGGHLAGSAAGGAGRGVVAVLGRAHAPTSLEPGRSDRMRRAAGLEVQRGSAGRSVGSERRSVGGTSRSLSGRSRLVGANAVSALPGSATRKRKPGTAARRAASGRRSPASASGCQARFELLRAERLGEQQRGVRRVLGIAERGQRAAASLVHSQPSTPSRAGSPRSG
jgi:hypothetical protein